MHSLSNAGSLDVSKHYTNPLGTLSNRHGINAIDLHNNFLYSGDILGYVSSWDLDSLSVNNHYKLDSTVINVKFTNNCIVSQTKKSISLLSNDLASELANKPSQTHTFARFALLNSSFIAVPHPQKDQDILLYSIENNVLRESCHIKTKSDKKTGPLHVLKVISDFEFIASHEIGSIFLYDIRKTDVTLINPIFIDTKSPSHSIEYFNKSLWLGTAEGELYYIKNVYSDDFDIVKYSITENAGIGNILKYEDSLLLGCWNGLVREFDFCDFSEKAVYHGHRATVTDMKLDFKHDILFTSGCDGQVCIWELLKL